MWCFYPAQPNTSLYCQSLTAVILKRNALPFSLCAMSDVGCSCSSSLFASTETCAVRCKSYWFDLHCQKKMWSVLPFRFARISNQKGRNLYLKFRGVSSTIYFVHNWYDKPTPLEGFLFWECYISRRALCFFTLKVTFINL